MYKPKHLSSNFRTKRQAGRYDQNHQSAKPNVFVTVLLCLLAAFFISVFIVLSVPRSAIAASVVRNADVVGILEGVGVDEHSYYFINQLNGLHFHDTEVSIDDVDEFIRSPAVSDEIGAVLGGFAWAFANGNLDYHISRDDVIDAAKNIEPELSSLFDHQMTEDDFDNFALMLDDVLDFETLTVGGILDELEANDVHLDLTLPQVIISPFLLIGVGVICVVLLAFIIIRGRYKLTSAVITAGIPVVLAGLVCFLLGSYIASSPESLGESISRIARYLDGPAHIMADYGLIVAIGGIVIIVIAFSLKFVGRARV